MKHLYANTIISLEGDGKSPKTVCGLDWYQDFNLKEYHDVNCLECWEGCLALNLDTNFKKIVEENYNRVRFKKDFKEMLK